MFPAMGTELSAWHNIADAQVWTVMEMSFIYLERDPLLTTLCLPQTKSRDSAVSPDLYTCSWMAHYLTSGASGNFPVCVTNRYKL